MSKTWAECEIRFLKKHYTDRNMSIGEISKMLGRPYSGVTAKASQLGLYRDKTNTPNPMRKRMGKKAVPPREIQDASYTNICASVLDGDSFEKIAEDTNRPVAQVKEIYEQGVRRGRLDAIKRYRENGYLSAARPRHYSVPKGFKAQGYKNSSGGSKK